MYGLLAMIPVSVCAALRVRQNAPLLIQNGESFVAQTASYVQTELGLPTVAEVRETAVKGAKSLLDGAMILMCVLGLGGIIAFLTNPILGLAIAGFAGAYLLRSYLNSPSPSR